MARVKNKTEGHIKIDPNRDPQLISKLRAIKTISPYEPLTLNTLARMLLGQKADEIIAEQGLVVNYSEPTRSARAG